MIYIGDTHYNGHIIKASIPYRDDWNRRMILYFTSEYDRKLQKAYIKIFDYEIN